MGIARPDRQLAERIVEASNEKYGQNQKESVEVGEFSPRLPFAWKVFFQDATRWRFG